MVKAKKEYLCGLCNNTLMIYKAGKRKKAYYCIKCQKMVVLPKPKGV